MTALFNAIFDCITGVTAEDRPRINEKQALICPHARQLDEVANDVVDTILRAEKADADLKDELDSIVGPYGWTEYLAERVLRTLGAALQGAHDKLGPAIRDAYHKAWDVANEIDGFVIQHPVMCTVIALGVLVVIAPWVIEALGFAELGPVEGSFASWWQSTAWAWCGCGIDRSLVLPLGVRTGLTFEGVCGGEDGPQTGNESTSESDAEVEHPRKLGAGLRSFF
ncbi:hypothetical protein OPT61_g1441 [Boeremia exigua]|uniref:Uncharacterized protein n=1 Tax=Boeremia exigua TaxID=749465 RepID=A0ACC2IQ53_9PLEO|nr:hypothetical protein OPT61_g1441 [Boeremia exigua]